MFVSLIRCNMVLLGSTKPRMPLLVLFTSFVISFTKGDSSLLQNSFEVFNRYTKKCLAFDSAAGLHLADCTVHLRTFLNWTESGNLKGYEHKCIQATANNSLTTGNCTSQDIVQWICEGSALRSQSGKLYLSWNPQTNEIEMTDTVTGQEGQWLLYKTDNNICTQLPHTLPSTTAGPFTQPSALPKERKSVQPWPRGIYSLPKASSGCPGSTNFTWKEGWVFQDLDDTGEIKTKSSPSFNMAANIDTYGNIKRWFCSKKTTEAQDKNRPPWPKGTYCIYSPPKCPKSEGTSKFKWGYGIWDNQYRINNSKKMGIVPFGFYVPGGTTGIFFCCQANDDPNNPVDLPTDQPFYLLAYRSSVCQKVKWATVIPEFIVYDTTDFANSDRFLFSTPFNATFHESDPKIYYCYYQGCNHTLNLLGKDEGDIRFPNSTFMDIASQSCSWRIRFPSEYAISLTVNSIDIPSNGSTNCSTQYLEVFDGEEDRSVGKLCGRIYPSTFDSLSNSVLIILKLGRNVTNTTGFHLSFKVISTQVTSEKLSEETTTMSVINSENPSTEKEPKSAQAKISNRKLKTTFIVVPVVIIVLVAIVLTVLVLIRRRKKNVNDNLVSFQKGFAQENPVYEGSSEKSETINDGENCNATIYESVDNEPTARITMNYSIALNKSEPTSNQFQNDGNDNPLYESSEQAEYSSTVNALYASNC